MLKGSGAQYFIGKFDGTRFINDASDDEILRVDHGMDFYAAQSWSDIPDGRRIWIGWLNNWHYADVIPTSPWRGVFSIPRELRLRKYPEGPRLIQRPVEELRSLRQSLYHIADTDVAKANSQLSKLKMDTAHEIRVELVAVKAQDVRAETSAAGELPRAVPAEDGLDADAQPLGDGAGREELAHAKTNRGR